MINYEKRNLEIMKMKKEGENLKQLSGRFGLSVERIRQVVLCYEFRKEVQEKSEEIRERFRSADDIDRKWPTDNIIVGLLFPEKVTWRLKRYFKSAHIQEISLKDLMDFLILVKKRRSTDLFEVVPAFKQKHFGRKTVYAMISHLSEQDLGNSFNTEWDKRLESLGRYFERTGHDFPLVLLKYLH